jgi:hypothetical protein
MLRITIHDNGKLRRLELAGKLAGEWVAETEKAFKADAGSKQTEVDLTAVTWVDESGRRLLRVMIQAGATMIAKGVAMTALVDEMRCPAPVEVPRTKRKHTKGVASMVLSAMLLPGVHLHAQEAVPEPLRLTVRDAQADHGLRFAARW